MYKRQRKDDDRVAAFEYAIEALGDAPVGNAPYATAIKYKSEPGRNPNETRVDAFRRQQTSQANRIGGRA